MKKRIFEILSVHKKGDWLSQIVDYFIVVLIVTNILALMLGTVNDAKEAIGQKFFNVFETVSIIIFTIEYLLRLWTCTCATEYAKPIRGRLKHACSFMAAVDLLVILPFYLPFIGIDLRFMRAIRLLRIFRIMKLGRYSKSLQTLANVMKNKKSDLLITLFVIIILTLVTSSMMYFIESEEQPEVFTSIPATMWWSIVTLTTVGYGDVTPCTSIGKLCGSIVALLGIGLFALPAGILGSGFIEELQKKKVKCPHCNKDI